MNTHSAVHQSDAYTRVSQADLRAYSETRRLKGTMKQRGRERYALNLWLFDEYFPVEARLLTKKEYKAELKARKNQPAPLSPDEIDRYTQGQPIPALANEMQRKLEMTRLRYQY